MARFVLTGRFLNLRPDMSRVLTAARTYCSSSGASARQRVNGVDLFYEQSGRGDHAVLLLPGALGSARTDFGPQLKSLNKERFTVIGWDPRGYGRSRPPDRDFPSDFYERDAADAVDLMKSLGFCKFSLLGWSDGGITSLIAAARSPELVLKLVVWGANAFVTQHDVELYNAVRDVSQWSARMRQPMEDMYGAEVFARTWAAWVDGITQFIKRPEDSLFWGLCTNIWRHLDKNLNVYIFATRALLLSPTGSKLVFKCLPLITCPTLIVHGEKDPMVPSFHPQYLLKHIKGSRLHLMPEGKHNLHLRFSEEFNKLVEDFLEK